MATGAPRTRKLRRHEEEPTDSAGGKPKNIVQWLLLYPAFGVALLTAGPQWYDRVGGFIQKKGSSLSESNHQNALWRKNIACLGGPSAWFQSTTNIKIDATICDSGDIFVQALTPDNTPPHIAWIALDDVVKNAAPRGNAVVPSANAATPGIAPAANPLFHKAQLEVLCQRFIDDRHVMRRVRTPDGCFDEIIDTFTNAVVKRAPAPCVPQCG